MPNATPRDTRAGFDLYRSTGGQLSLDALNSRLIASGYGAISPRTYRHYRHLVEAGFNRYISINRFDVARASAPYESASALGRYSYREVDLGVAVVFAKSSRMFEAFGQATEVGEVGSLLQFHDPEVIHGLRALRPQSSDMVTIRYLDAGRTVGGRVIEVDLEQEPAIVEVEYARLISIVDIGVGQALPVSDARFLLRGPEDQSQTLDVIGRRLYYFFGFLEGLRAIINDAGEGQPNQVYAPPPVLQRLSVASPADLVIELASQLHGLIPAGLIALVLTKAWDLPAKRKQWYEGTGQKTQNDLLELDKEIKQLELEAKKHEVELRSEIVQRVRNEFPNSSVTDDRIKGMIDEYVLPPLRGLGRNGVTELGERGDAPDSESNPEQLA